MTNVLIVDDHPLFCSGFQDMVRSLRRNWTIRCAMTGAEALAQVGATAPDVTIIDLGLPDGDGFSLSNAIAHAHPLVPRILISGREDTGSRIRAQAGGARAFIAKTQPPEQILRTIDLVLAGHASFIGDREAMPLPALTQRQAEVLSLLAEGHSDKEICYRLGIAERTVRAHLTELFQLLGAHSRTQAIIRGRDMGLIG